MDSFFYSPTIDFFRHLPKDFNNKWGVYVHVLEKPKHRPRIYICSGTKAIAGVQFRISQYNESRLHPDHHHAATASIPHRHYRDLDPRPPRQNPASLPDRQVCDPGPPCLHPQSSNNRSPLLFLGPPI
ncbi:hypothetical protein K505DRAFT_332649 [Melanomma pulvis-pyrius CBS 109.77]|uniref:Uncharacterized protein n=1 Tax=Melanomma pulvis-pyrius CBS 109.77 TaxID=1314802 RepID=A0A6A6XTF4_9PLEO|nr:hypothetical protein K505DRAFT_332649 [Melanomma pulvis-pyrius CBS 109.77]